MVGMGLLLFCFLMLGCIFMSLSGFFSVFALLGEEAIRRFGVALVLRCFQVRYPASSLSMHWLASHHEEEVAAI